MQPRFMKRIVQRTLLSAGTVMIPHLFVGCSLTDIPFVRVGECTSDASCNEALGAKCAEYECVSATDKQGKSFNQCRKLEGEQLDGLDNDCDGIVDNGDEETPLTVAQGEEVAVGLGNIETISIANSEALSQIYIQEDLSKASVLAPTGGDPVQALMMANPTDGRLDKSLEPGCHSAGGSDVLSCDINQIAVSAGETIGYFAQIKTEGCRQGELRVGAIDPADPTELIDRGPFFRNPAYQGVATFGSRCSQNTSQECIDAKQRHAELVEQNASTSELGAEREKITTHCGVSRPSVAAQRDQALVSFLSARVEDDICDLGAIDVLGLLLHERTGPRGGEFVWADPSGDGVPDVLGTTISAQPPALHAIHGAGFLLAHPEQSGEITLTFIEHQPSPPGNVGTQCPDDGCDSRTGYETASISGIEEFTKLTTSGDADGIRMQWLPTGDGEGVLLVTWVRGCSPNDHQLEDTTGYAQAIRLDVSDETPEVIWKGDVINLGPTRSFPLAVPSQRTFVVEGFERNGKTASEKDLGGFYVLTRPLGLQAVRIAAFDGARASANEVIPVDPLSDDPDSRPNTYRYLGAMGHTAPDQFFFKTTGGEASLFRATFDSGN